MKVLKSLLELILFAICVTIAGFIFELFGIWGGWEWDIPGEYIFGVPLLVIFCYFVGGIFLFILATVTYQLVDRRRGLTILLSAVYGVVSIVLVSYFILGGEWLLQGIFWFALFGALKGVYLTRKCDDDALMCVYND